MIAEILGLRGASYVTATSAQSGRWVAIDALEDTVFASITSSTLEGTLTNVPLKAGNAIAGRITAFTLTSGKVIAYNG